MRCVTCENTMHAWGEAGQVFVCSRCGTVKDSEGVQTPLLVPRVLSLCNTLTDDDQHIIARIEKFGIRECITKVPL